VQTAAEMFEAVKKHAAKADIFIGVAAVADYRTSAPRKHKIKKTEEDQLHISLLPNPDILGWIASRPKPPFCVGFAAESRNLDAYADEKRRRKKVRLMIANLAQNAIGADDHEVSMLDDNGTHRLPRASKDAVAQQIVAHIAGLCDSKARKSK
jgi:phosphopantothenoylcysteine decarboxylase/phosphopantothenate--cysteine ligase